MFISGQQGDVILWESSADNFNTIDTLTTSADTIETPQIFGDVCFRALVRDVPCPAVYSTVACFQVTSSDAGTVQPPRSICRGDGSGQIELTGNANNVLALGGVYR